MKLLFVICIILFLGSCVSQGQLSVEKTTQVENPQTFAKPLTVNLGGDAQWDKLFNQAVAACENQQWEQAINIYADGAARAPENLRRFFLAFLIKLTSEQFPVKQACAQLAALIPQAKSRWETLAKLSESQPFSVELPEEPVVLPWVSGGTYLENHPIVDVVINGKQFRLIVDTGAETTAIFASAAKSLEFQNIPELAVSITDIYGKESTKLSKVGILKEVVIGDIKVRNSRVFVIADQPALSGTDGFLGWSILSQLAVVFDYKQKSLRFECSSGVRAPVRNLVWIDYPIVKTVYGQEPGSLLWLGLDTGANYSFFADSYLNALHIKKGKNQKITTFGANGANQVDEVQIEAAPLYLDGSKILYKNYWNNWRTVGSNLNIHGCLGNDIMSAGVLRLDFPAGRASFVPY